MIRVDGVQRDGVAEVLNRPPAVKAVLDLRNINRLNDGSRRVVTRIEVRDAALDRVNIEVLGGAVREYVDDNQLVVGVGVAVNDARAGIREQKAAAIGEQPVIIRQLVARRRALVYVAVATIEPAANSVAVLLRVRFGEAEHTRNAGRRVAIDKSPELFGVNV